MKIRNWILLLVSATFVLTACKKPHNEPTPPTPPIIEEKVTQEEVELYYLFDKKQGIEGARKRIEEVKEEKEIRGKHIRVREAKIKDPDEKQGSFVLDLKGSVNGQDFSGSYNMSGFHKEEEPKPQVEVTVADIELYYAFDKSKDLSVARKQIEKTKDEREVNGKKIRIPKAQIVTEDKSQGLLVIEVEGTVNEEAFSGSYAIEGFKKEQPQPGDVTLEHIEEYYAFDKNQGVDAAKQKIEQTKDERLVGGRKICINQAKVTFEDKEQGMLSIEVEGTVNEFPFSGSYTIRGFKKEMPKPDPVTLEDIEQYYAFDKNQGVGAAKQKIEQTKDERLVGGRKIRINRAKVTSEDKEQGMLSIEVEGTVNEHPFSGSYTIRGFKKEMPKPDPVTLEDIEQYYAFDKNQGVGAAKQKIEQTKDERLVGGRKIRINRAKVTSEDKEQGILSIEVEGTVNEHPFSGSYTIRGFKKELPKPEPAVVTQIDIEQYYNFDKKKGVDEAIQKIAQEYAEKFINGKRIRVNEAQATSVDKIQGTFSLNVKGTVNGEVFENTFPMSGFRYIPEAYMLGNRAVAMWNVTPSVYHKQFDIEPLFIENNPAMYTTEYLKRFIKFSSSYIVPGSGNVVVPYDFTEEELQSLTVEDIKCHFPLHGGTGRISFKIRYKGYKSKDQVSLPFDLKAFYAFKVLLDSAFAPSKYMRGVHKYLDLFYGHALKYDEERYVAELVSDSKQKDDHSNHLSFRVLLSHRSSGKELFILDKIIDGFKPLSKLQDELVISSSADLRELIKKRIEKMPPSGDPLSRLKRDVSRWIKLAQFELQLEFGDMVLLNWAQEIEGGYPVDVLMGGSSPREGLDLYLVNPRWDLVEAQFVGKNLHLKVQLLSANDVALEQVFYSFIIHGVRD